MSKIIMNAVPIMPTIQLECTGCRSIVEYTNEDAEYLVNPSYMDVWFLTCPICGENTRYPDISFHDLYRRNRDGSYIPPGDWGMR